MRTFAPPLAIAIVVVIPLTLAGFVSSLERWSRWLLRTGGTLGVVGLAFTGVTVVNLFVPRTCASDPVQEVNRPVISVVLGDGSCFESALAQVQLTVLVGLATSVAVVRRSARGDDDATPAVPIL